MRSQHDIDNYWTINNYSLLPKLFEPITHVVTDTHLQENNLISPAWCGFQKSLSCASCQLDSSNHANQLHDRGLSAIVVYFDLFKNFTNLSHPTELTKFSACGTTDLLLSLVHYFLNNHTQCVKIDNYTFEVNPNDSGVVQWGALRPLLFSIYASDICDRVVHWKWFRCVGDLKVIYSFVVGPLIWTGVTIQIKQFYWSQGHRNWDLHLSSWYT